MLRETIAAGKDFQLHEYMNTSSAFSWLGSSSDEEDAPYTYEQPN